MKGNIIMDYFKMDGTKSDFDNCDYCQIKLKGNHAETLDANILISKQSLNLVVAFEWYLGSDGYPVAYKCLDSNNSFGRGIKLHKLLKGNECPTGMVIDHINHDRLDNRLENLRICTPKENSYNTSKKKNKKDKKYNYKGVSKTNNSYVVTITKDGVTHKIKDIQSEKEAAQIYDMMAEDLFGNFAGKNYN